MFTKYTWEDWLSAPEDKRALILQIIRAYKAGDDFQWALTAKQYFNGNDEAIRQKYVLKMDVQEERDADTGATRLFSSEVRVKGTRLSSDFFGRFVTQEAQHILANGVSLETPEMKARLGSGFDTALARMAEKALVQGVCWGFWNLDHVEPIDAAADAQSGAVALLGETDGNPHALIQFWRLHEDKPLCVRVFEPDGVTEYREGQSTGLVQKGAKQPYRRTVYRDAIGTQTVVNGGAGALPIVPLYANPAKRSELTEAVKSKVDCYDRIASDFGDNLEMANDVYWVLNNFGGSTRDVLRTLEQIRKLRAVVNISDGTGSGSTAEPHTFEVPYEARQTALSILREELYRDAMAMDTKALTGGSLTNVAIQAACFDLNVKCNRFEWQLFAFVQGILRLAGVETEDISFKRQSISNDTETIQNIYAMRGDIDRETALRLNPYINQEDIPTILEALDAEAVSGQAGIEAFQKKIDALRLEE